MVRTLLTTDERKYGLPKKAWFEGVAPNVRLETWTEYRLRCRPNQGSVKSTRSSKLSDTRRTFSGDYLLLQKLMEGCNVSCFAEVGRKGAVA